MPALAANVLVNKLRAALPEKIKVSSGGDEHRPVEVLIPDLGRVLVYLWTITEDRSSPGARPPGEYKIQLILPGQPRDQQGEFAFAADTLTVLLGYSAEFGVFVGWDAYLHSPFGYSKNAQVPVELREEARAGGWAVAPPRRLQNGPEVRVAFTPGNLSLFLQ